MFIPSVKYEVVLGVYEGYDIPDILDEVELRNKIDSDCSTVLEKWKEFALEYFDLHNTYVSAVAFNANTLYSNAWGCPKYGEPVVVFHCILNPEFI